MSSSRSLNVRFTICFAQSLPSSFSVSDAGVWRALRNILKHEGIGGLYRGVSAVIIGAIPGHALHFMVYEVSRCSLSKYVDMSTWILSFS